jgi:hypothetical protein
VTEDDALAQLRDIHLPAELSAAASIQFAIWPFIGLAIFIGTVLVIRLWSGQHWRRRAQAELSRIAEAEDPAQQWSQLLDFAKSLPERTGRKVTLPGLAYRRPETIDEGDRAAFIDFVRTELSR